MKYKGIIFDFNGVLLWDSHFHERAWIAMSKKLRGEPFSENELHNYLHGRINKKLFEYLLGHEISKEESDKLEIEKEGMYMQQCLENIAEYKLSKGAEDLLDFVVNKKIPHIIATASPKILLDFYEKHLYLSRWFDLSKIVYNDGTFQGKPAPDMYLKAAERIGLLPKDGIVIEDAVAGIASAHAAGIGYIIAIGPKESHEKLRNLPGVNKVITTLEEINKEELFSY